MLLYRWMLSWVSEARYSNRRLAAEDEREAMRVAAEGVDAAQDSAKLLYMIFVEGSAIKNVWSCMQVTPLQRAQLV